MTPWLSIVGIGEDGLAGLDPSAREMIEQASLLVGGERHLALIPASVSGASRLVWRQPFSDTIGDILARRGHAVVVLASGDPMHYGVGATLARYVAIAEMRVLPRPSAFSLAAARLGWALQDTAQITLHGRPLERVARFVAPQTRLLALSENGTTPAKLAFWMCDYGWGGSDITVLQNLGGPREEIWRGAADTLTDQIFSDLNIIAVEYRPDARATAYSGLAGLPDDAFLHDGQLTKREVRAATLAALAPLPGQLLWDIGAGCGSISIEWLRSGNTMRAIAVENVATRLEMMRRNAFSLGVPELSIVEGHAPQALQDLPCPDAIFIGGGIEEALLDTLWAALRPGGKMVANTVTLEGERIVLAAAERFQGSLTRIAINRAERLGGHLVWRPAMPVTQFCAVKPR